MWDRSEPLMPADPVRGRRWADHRRTLEAIAWKYRTNSPWRGLPDELGSFRTAHKRLIRWAVDGTCEKILAAVLTAADAADDIGWTVSVDSTVVRPTSTPPEHSKRGRRPQRAGRSRTRTLPRGLSTKIHLAADGHARPLALTVTVGQAGDAPAFETVMARIRVPRSGHGRPRSRPTTVLADRAYSSRAIRAHLCRRQIRAVIPQPSDQIGHRLRRGRRGGRPPGFDADADKQRNTVERCINRLKQWRGLATRTDRLAIAYQAALHIAAILESHSRRTVVIGAGLTRRITMRSSTDRVAALSGTGEVRSLLATNLAGYESYVFSELARAARDRLANTPALSVGILARELRRAGLAISRHLPARRRRRSSARNTFTRTGCDWWASAVDRDGPGLVQAHLIDPCEQLLRVGNTDERDDGYAALRAGGTAHRDRGRAPHQLAEAEMP
ncbi:IS5 family transposase [Streptomyces luteogriseus]|uniref:IS5 family transposase n=1 Tax=Streptomyces luteogriseus TaxID=68233 RepID=UPI0036BC88FE